MHTCHFRFPSSIHMHLYIPYANKMIEPNVPFGLSTFHFILITPGGDILQYTLHWTQNPRWCRHQDTNFISSSYIPSPFAADSFNSGGPLSIPSLNMGNIGVMPFLGKQNPGSSSPTMNVI